MLYELPSAFRKALSKRNVVRTRFRREGRQANGVYVENGLIPEGLTPQQMLRCFRGRIGLFVSELFLETDSRVFVTRFCLLVIFGGLASERCCDSCRRK